MPAEETSVAAGYRMVWVTLQLDSAARWQVARLPSS
jgi:hypothetical protein